MEKLSITSFWKIPDAVDYIMSIGYASLFGGVWFAYSPAHAFIVLGAGLMGFGLFAMRGGR